MKNEVPREKKNLYELLYDSAQRYADKNAIFDEAGGIQYGDLLQKVDCLAECLIRKFHLKPGDRVGVMFVNCIDFYIVFYALMKIRAIAVMVNTKMQAEEIEFVLGDTSVSCLILNNCWIDKVSENLENLHIFKVITDHPLNVKFKKKFQVDNLENILAKGIFEVTSGIDLGENQQTAVILHTSGTTGRPKGIMISHKNIIETATGYQNVLKVDFRDTTILSVPVFHILGLSCVSNLFLSIGGTIVAYEKYNTKKILEGISRYRATHFHSVPAVYIKLLENWTKEYNLTSLRIAVCGGDIINEEYIDKFCKIAPNASFRIAYGLTETAGSGVLSYYHREPGREVPNCQLKIWDDKANILKGYGSGEAVFEGNIVAQKVWGKEGVSFNLYTGDIVEKDENGFIYVRGRKKDIINRGGEKIFPFVIETALKKYPHVENAVVFAVSDRVYGEVPMAVLTSKKDGTPDLDFIKKDIRKHIGKYELPKDIEVWDTRQIPYTGNGKIRKLEMRKRYERRKLNEKA